MCNPNHVLYQPSVGAPIPWYESADKAREVLGLFPDFTFSHLEWEAFAFPGGYEIHYYTEGGGTLCHQCANEHLLRTIDPDDDQFHIVGQDVLWEGYPIQCDHCGREIQPEYGD